MGDVKGLSEVSNIIKPMLDAMARQMGDAMFGGCPTNTTEAEVPTLSFDKLRALYDYLKPEALSVAGEDHQIYGFNVHTAYCPDGITVLTEKVNPNEPLPRRGKLVIINEHTGKAILYEPPERSIEL